MIKKITITSEGYFDKITFSREKNSPYIDMEFNYHNGCRYSSFKLEDMIKVIEILNETDLPNIKDGKEEYTLHNGKKIYAEYNEYNICQVTKECIELLLDLYQQGRVDAIDEFVKKICEKYTKEESKGNYKQYCGDIKQNIADIAEQLKVKE